MNNVIQQNKRRAIVKTALLFGLLALLFYIGFITMAVIASG